MLAVTYSSCSSIRTGTRTASRSFAHRRHRVLRPLQSRQDEDELVAAHAGHGVAVAQAGLQPAAERHQQSVAHRVPEAVVDRLEPVDVQKRHRHQLSGPGGATQRHVQPIVEQAPVRQSRQLVMSGLKQHPIAVRLLQGHVANRGDPAPRSSGTARPSTPPPETARRRSECRPSRCGHCVAEAAWTLGNEQLVDLTAGHRRRRCGRRSRPPPDWRPGPGSGVQHHDPFAHGVHDRPKLLLALLQRQLTPLRLGDVRVDAR